jgi:ribonuclease HII
MSESDREQSYQLIINSSDVIWGVSIVSHTEIDEINILQASLVGMKRACDDLLSKLKNTKKTTTKGDISMNSKFIALVDGNKLPKDMPVPTVYVIKGDSYVYSISVASIIAKVTRDRIMVEQHKLYPEYNFMQHKGYPTFQHRQTLYEIGPCPIHRSTYAPVKQALIKFADGKGKYMGKATTKKEEVKVVIVVAKVSTSKRNPVVTKKKPVAVAKKAGIKANRPTVEVGNVKRSLSVFSDKKKKKKKVAIKQKIETNKQSATKTRSSLRRKSLIN